MSNASCALVSKNDQGHMRRFLKNLRTWGLQPRVVVSDDSPLYPKVLAELWPEAEHQLCVFHVLKNINKLVLDAVRRLRNGLARRGNGGRRKRREFVDRVYRLLALEQSEHQAWCRRAALVKQKAYQAVPELNEALKMLAPEKFTKMIAFLRSPAAQRVRTNNHVERANRKLRFWEKVRYKWRRRRTLVRFMVLALDHWWKRLREIQAKPVRQSAKKRARKTNRKTRKSTPPEITGKPYKNAA